MSERERQTDVAGALRLLATVEPPAGMAQRVVARMRKAERADEVALQRSWQPWLVAGAGICAAVAMMLALWPWNPAKPLRPREQEAIASSGRLGSSDTGRPLRFHAEHPVRRRLRVPHRSEPEAREVSFPAPPAPLTHEEQLLLRLSAARTPAEAAMKQVLAQSEPAQVPGERLPSLPRETLGEPLPVFAAETPGHALPNFFEAMKTGDQP